MLHYVDSIQLGLVTGCRAVLHVIQQKCAIRIAEMLLRISKENPIWSQSFVELLHLSGGIILSHPVECHFDVWHRSSVALYCWNTRDFCNR